VKHAAALLVLSLAACQSAVVPGGGTFEADASQVTVGMKMKMTENGITRAEVYADTARSQPGATLSQLTRVRLEFIMPSGARGKMTSKTGEYDPGSEVMVARGNVVLVIPGENGKGTRTIRSEELHWDQRGDRVWSTKPTSMEEEGRTLYTDNFTSDSRFTNVQGTNARSSAVKMGEGGFTF
jgi:LPS export ABC transporter protein LptC